MAKVDPILNRTKFYKLIHKIEDLPKDNKPQIVLAGKSNVGKSSLVNRLCGQRRLARTAQEPGKTRNLIFFDVDDKFYLVDLPGYGFSKSSKAEQARFSKLTDDYLHSGSPIALILHLLDARHDPTKQDIQMLHWLEEVGAPYTILLNKMDKLSRPQQGVQSQKIKQKIKKETGHALPVLSISSETGQGIEDLSRIILETVDQF